MKYKTRRDLIREIEQLSTHSETTINALKESHKKTVEEKTSLIIDLRHEISNLKEEYSAKDKNSNNTIEDLKEKLTEVENRCTIFQNDNNARYTRAHQLVDLRWWRRITRKQIRKHLNL